MTTQTFEQMNHEQQVAALKAEMAGTHIFRRCQHLEERTWQELDLGRADHERDCTDCRTLEIHDPLRAALRALTAQHGSLRAWAAATGADHSLASKVLRGAKPTPALLKAMGWTRRTVYEPCPVAATAPPRPDPGWRKHRDTLDHSGPS